VARDITRGLVELELEVMGELLKSLSPSTAVLQGGWTSPFPAVTSQIPQLLPVPGLRDLIQANITQIYIFSTRLRVLRIELINRLRAISRRHVCPACDALTLWSFNPYAHLTAGSRFFFRASVPIVEA
jgi:hypothetical protein